MKSQTTRRLAYGLLNGAVVSLIVYAPLYAAVMNNWKVDFAEAERRLDAQDLPGAEDCFRKALSEVRKKKSASQDEIARCMQSLAAVLEMQDKTDEEVIPLYRKALKRLERAHGKDSQIIIPTLIALAKVHEGEGDYQKAMAVFARAVAITEKTSGASSFAVAEYKHLLGRAAFAAGLPRRAEEQYRSSLALMMTQSSLPSARKLEDLLSDYIDLFRKSGGGKVLTSRFQQELLKDQVGKLEVTEGLASSQWSKQVSVRLADPGLSKPIDAAINGTLSSGAGEGALKEEERIFGAQKQSSPDLPRIIPDKPMPDFVALEQMNRQRIDFYERMIATDVNSLGPSHPSVARDLSGLAAIYLARKKYAEAKPLLMRALEIYQSAYGSDALLSRRTRSLIELISSNQASPPAEIALSDDYLKGLPVVPIEAQKLEIALRLNYLAFLSYSQGRLQDAEKMYAWAAASTASATGSQSPLLAACLIDYSRVLRSCARAGDAERMEGMADAISRHVMVEQTSIAIP